MRREVLRARVSRVELLFGERGAVGDDLRSITKPMVATTQTCTASEYGSGSPIVRRRRTLPFLFYKYAVGLLLYRMMHTRTRGKCKIYTCKTYHDHKIFVYALLYTLYGLRLYPKTRKKHEGKIKGVESECRPCHGENAWP